MFAAPDDGTADPRNNVHPYYRSRFGLQPAPAGQVFLFPGQTGSAPLGTIGFAWRRVAITKIGQRVVWAIDDLPIASVDVGALTFGGSNIFLNHFDLNLASSANPNARLLAFGLVDNLVVTRISLEEALDTVGIQWVSGGNQVWNTSGPVTHDGVDAANSGPINDLQETWLEAFVVGPGTLGFWWKVSSEMGYDLFEFTVDSEVKRRVSGAEDWEQVAWTLGDGPHTVRWRYVKDDATAKGEDRAWLDEVVFVPDLGPPVMVAEPTDRTVGLGDVVTLDVGVGGGRLQSYQWFRGERLAIEGATNRILSIVSINHADPADTLVIVDALLVNHVLNPVAHFVKSGGRAILQYWALNPGSALASAFDASVEETLLLPRPVHAWGGSPFLAGFANPIELEDRYTFSGQGLQPGPGGQAVSGYSPESAFGQASVVTE